MFGFKTKAEKKAFKQGLMAGLKKKKNSRGISKNKKYNKVPKKSSLRELHKKYRDRNLGALEYNGKIYDTNFKDGPHEITKEDIEMLRSEYDIHGKMSDKEVADSYVRHMRRKYGVEDAKTGKWLGLLSDVKKMR